MKVIPVSEPVPGQVLDLLLSYGFYRMQQSFFSTLFIHADEERVARVVWTRVRLDGFESNHRLRKLDKLNRRFSITLQPAVVDDEREALYAKYRAHIDFDGWPSVASCLLGDGSQDHFPGRMWSVRDEGRLIAVGYFDEGLKSCAGILNFYDPDYAKHSLGLWLYLNGVRYAAQSAKQYFYPGYLVVGLQKFDYKLLAGTERIELFEPVTGRWLPYHPDLLHA